MSVVHWLPRVWWLLITLNILVAAVYLNSVHNIDAELTSHQELNIAAFQTFLAVSVIVSILLHWMTSLLWVKQIWISNTVKKLMKVFLVLAVMIVETAVIGVFAVAFLFFFPT